MIESIQRYVEKGIRPGDFLTAVICNDLFEAIGRADEDNLRNLPAIVGYFYNKTPPPCWGSPQKMNAWRHAIDQDQLKGIEALEQRDEEPV
jgi:hypothetical protein